MVHRGRIRPFIHNVFESRSAPSGPAILIRRAAVYIVSFDLFPVSCPHWRQWNGGYAHVCAVVRVVLHIVDNACIGLVSVPDWLRSCRIAIEGGFVGSCSTNQLEVVV